MPPQLCLTVRFPGGAFHGRAEGGRPEWPPSPLRVFQALVAAAARRDGGKLRESTTRALEWLERQPAPRILAPPSVATVGYGVPVPHNAMDIVARAWVRGNIWGSGDANPATHRTMKAVRPVRFEDGAALYVIWPCDVTPPAAVVAVLTDAARSVAALGWGVDTTVADVTMIDQEAAIELPGEEWVPGAQSAAGLRVPIAGSLEDVLRRHDGFVNRLAGGVLRPPPPLSVYARLEYRRAADPMALPFAAFSLVEPANGRFLAFDAARRALSVAGMTRHVTRLTAERAGWSPARIAQVVLGHGEAPGADHAPVPEGRLAYVPLPSVEWRGSGMRAGPVRRVLVTQLGDGGSHVGWARRALDGAVLVEETSTRTMALLQHLPDSDRVVQLYAQRASVWTTVTPVVLPGFDDPDHYRRRMSKAIAAAEQRVLLAKLEGRTDRLLRKAIAQAGLSPTLAAHARLEWRTSGFVAGVDLAGRYGVPRHLQRFPRLHVKIRWFDGSGRPTQVPGPICLGGGRFVGLGLCVPLTEEAPRGRQPEG